MQDLRAAIESQVLVAAESWPARFPMIRTRIGFPQPSGILDDFSHGHAEAIVDDDNLSARDQTRVDVDVDGFTDPAVQFEHRTGAELEQFGDFDCRAPDDSLNARRARQRPASGRRRSCRACRHARRPA